MVNNSTVENIATNKVKEVLNYTGCIDTSFIKEGDKEPVWDGHIYIYSSKDKHSKDTLKYRIPVQIKGTTNPIENTLKYNIGIKELNLYLNEGGVLYFVVRVNTVTKNNQIYYALLLPYNLKNLLSLVGKKKSVSCELSPFPVENTEIFRIISEFAEHRLLQQGLIHIDEAAVQNFNEIIIPVVRVGKNFDLNKFLLNYEGLGYGKTEQGINVPIPVKRGEITQEILINGEVSIGNRVYFTRLVRKINVEHDILILNDNLELIIDNTLKGTCILKYKGGLSNCIDALSFIVELGKYKEFSINGITKKLIINKNDIKVFADNLSFLMKLQKTLEKCDICTELQLNSFNEQDIKNINLLIWTIGENNEIELSITQEIYPFRIFISNQCILCIAIRQNNGKYQLQPFNNKVNFEQKGISVSPYEYLGAVFFKHVINLDYDNVLEDIKRYGNDDKHLQKANMTALEILKAYDETGEKKLLNLSATIFNWLEDNAISNKTIYHLNCLQCKIRENGNISDLDKDYLHEIIEENNTPIVKYGAYILLQDKQGAERQFKKFNSEDQNNIKQFPIYRLWEQLNGPGL